MNLNVVRDIRTEFVKKWYEKGSQKDYPNVVFDWQRKINNNEYMDCYNHWLLMKGNEDEFNTWYNAHKESFDAFAKWYNDNPMQLNKKHQFFRLQYNR